MPNYPYDEPEIEPDDIIIRRINPSQHVIFDSNRGCDRISTKAYTPSSEQYGGMSVDIESLILSASLIPQNFVTNPIFTGAVYFSAQIIRSFGLRIGYDPIPGNPYHGEVWGPAEKPNKFTGSQKVRLAESASWYVAIPNVQLK